MEHIFDGFSLTDLTNNATDIISSLSPLVSLLVGIGLAFLVISFIISMLTGKKEYNDDGWPSDDDTPYDDDFDDDEY